MPRTGSELVAHYFRYVQGMAYGGEFLAFDVGNPTTLHIQPDEQLFFYKNGIRNASGYVDIEREYDRRIDAIATYETTERPVVVKAFSSIFQTNPTVYDKIRQRLTMIIVARRDVLKSVASTLICTQHQIWHGNRDVMDAAHASLTKFVVDLNFARMYFDAHLHHAKIWQQHKQLGDIVLLYEEFQQSPYALIGRQLKLQPKNLVSERLSSFIRNGYQQVISNYSELENVYIVEYANQFQEIYGTQV